VVSSQFSVLSLFRRRKKRGSRNTEVSVQRTDVNLGHHAPRHCSRTERARNGASASLGIREFDAALSNFILRLCARENRNLNES